MSIVRGSPLGISLIIFSVENKHDVNHLLSRYYLPCSMTDSVLLKLPMLLVAITMYDPNCVFFIAGINICDVTSNPFELLCDFITLSIK